MSKNFDQLDPASALSGAETLAVNQAGVTMSTTINAIIAFMGSIYDTLGTAAAAIAAHLSAYVHSDIAHSNRSQLDLVSGTNTGDQDLSGYATKTGAIFSDGILLSNTNDANPLKLDWFEEGTWTPNDASGAGLSFTVLGAYFTRIGNTIFIQARITFPITTNTNTVNISGLPYHTALSGQSLNSYPVNGTSITSNLGNVSYSPNTMIISGFYKV